jgi:hypothetical protein
MFCFIVDIPRISIKINNLIHQARKMLLQIVIRSNRGVAKNSQHLETGLAGICDVA